MEKKDRKSDNNSIFNKDIAEYLGLGLQLAATVTVMVFLGLWLDGKFGTSPILTIVCAFFGVFAGMYNFIKTVIKSEK